MGRIRTIKPEFWTHEELSALPESTHMLAGALLNYADDEGYFNANPGLVKAACFPLREPSVSLQTSLQSLVKIGYLRLGSTPDGKRFGQIVKFDDHQRVNRPTPSKISALPVVWDDAVNPHAQLTEDSSPERKGKEGKGREEERKTRTRVPKPDLTLTGWLDTLADGSFAIPLEDPIFDWASKAGIPPDWIDLAWRAFADRYGPNGASKAKRYADWRAVFRTAVKDDWLHVWRHTPNGYVLTTVGETWKRAA